MAKSTHYLRYLVTYLYYIPSGHLNGCCVLSYSSLTMTNHPYGLIHNWSDNCGETNPQSSLCLIMDFKVPLGLPMGRQLGIII